MLRYLVPLLVTLSAVTSYQNRAPYSHQTFSTAASSAQIRFAEENKYDDTGPGAKKPENAYKTYKNLDAALVAYLDDPDTKLPEFERERAVKNLLKSTGHLKPGIFGQYPKTFNPPPFKQQYEDLRYFPFSHITSKNVYTPRSKTEYDGGFFNGRPGVKQEPFKLHKFQEVKESPVSIAHYTRRPDLKSSFEEFDTFPRYSYSYGVHDKSTGDLKHAAENREGDTVRGFYSFIDANGKHHTVHYSDTGKGFRASVSKLPLRQ